MNVSSVGTNPSVPAAMASRQNDQVKTANNEARESAAREASESRATQIAEGDVGRLVNTYA